MNRLVHTKMRAYLCTMCSLIYVLLGVRVWHASGVPPHDVEVGTRSHAGLAVPLYLSGTCIHHGRGEDGQYCALWLQNSLLHDCLMLFHSHCEWNIIILGPATYSKKDEHQSTFSLEDLITLELFHLLLYKFTGLRVMVLEF